jgi:hypothetical protein
MQRSENKVYECVLVLDHMFLLTLTLLHFPARSAESVPVDLPEPQLPLRRSPHPETSSAQTRPTTSHMSSSS